MTELSPRRETTLASYQRDAAAYAAGIPVDLPDELAGLMDSFVTLLPPSPSVLEIGSGSGRDALQLEQRGVVVRRTDITPAFVDLIRASGHAAHVLDPLRDDVGGPYDGVWANAVLLHLARDEVEPVLRRLRDAVHPGGALCLTLKEGDGEAWSAHGHVTGPRHFTYWRPDPLAETVTSAGWSLESLSSRVAESGQPWLLALATRP